MDEEPVVRQLPLSPEQRGWLEKAWQQIDPERLAELDRQLVSIPSPTGEERMCAEFIAAHLREQGIEGMYQPMDERQGNALGRIRGSGGGPDLLLYAPIDIAFAGTEEEDSPWLGDSIRPDRKPGGFIEDGFVVGAGAENPKGYATCVIAAAEAIRKAEIPLKGDLLVGLGAGGMPTNKRPGIDRWNAGQGSGASFMLEQGFRGDFCVLAKPGWSVSWEEVGLCWFEVRVHGILSYTGIRHITPYRNAIIEATKVIAGLERWFPEYSKRHTDGLVAPQGSIGAIEGGWTYKPSFPPMTCNLYVDIRISPRTDVMQLKREFGEALAQIQRENEGLELDWEMILSVPGTHTPPDNWIVQSMMRAWEELEGRPHQALRNTSGATDAAILRGRGLPVARLGIPRAQGALPQYGGFSMGVVDPRTMERLTRALVYGVIDTCTRTRDEVGLKA